MAGVGFIKQGGGGGGGLTDEQVEALVAAGVADAPHAVTVSGTTFDSVNNILQLRLLRDDGAVTSRDIDLSTLADEGLTEAQVTAIANLAASTSGHFEGIPSGSLLADGVTLRLAFAREGLTNANADIDLSALATDVEAVTDTSLDGVGSASDPLKIADGGIEAEHFGIASVPEGALQDQSVGQAKITDGAIHLAKHAPQSVDESKLTAALASKVNSHASQLVLNAEITARTDGDAALQAEIDGIEAGPTGPAGPAGRMIVTTLYAPESYRALGTGGYSGVSVPGWRDMDLIILRTANASSPAYIGSQVFLTANILLATAGLPHTSIGSGSSINGNAVAVYPLPENEDTLQFRGATNADYIVDIKGIGGGELVSPTPRIIFEGDVSAQDETQRVINLTENLPATGRLYFTGDTAQIDTVNSQVVVDTPEKKLLTFGEIYCDDLTRNPGLTVVQAQENNWNTFANLSLYNAGIYDPDSLIDEEGADSVSSNTGIYIARVKNTAGEIVPNQLAVKLGYENNATSNIRDLAPLKIRYIQ